MRQNSATIIDNIFANNPELVFVSGNIDSYISDHFLHFSRYSFVNDLALVNWNDIFLRGDYIKYKQY